MIPTKLGDDTSTLPVPNNISYVDDETHLLGAGDTFLIPHFLTETESYAAFQELTTEIPYQQWYHMPSEKSSGLKPLSRTKCALGLPREDGWMPHYRFPVNDQNRYPVIPIQRKNTYASMDFAKSSRNYTH